MSAAIWKGNTFTRHAPTGERVVAFGLLGVSLVGTYLALGGTLRPDPVLVLAAIVYQLLMTTFQYINAARWRSSWYLIPLLMSAVPATIGFATTLGGIAVPAIVGIHEGIAPYASFLWWAFVAIASFGLDILPEQILVDRQRGRAFGGGSSPTQRT